MVGQSLEILVISFFMLSTSNARYLKGQQLGEFHGKNNGGGGCFAFNLKFTSET
jgi:hypothetical protein